MPLTGAARLAGVMGWPVAHSLSPCLHGHWFERHAVDGAYVPLPVTPENLELAFDALPRLGFRGWNVTIPHKLAVLDLDPQHAQPEAVDQRGLGVGDRVADHLREGAAHRRVSRERCA